MPVVVTSRSFGRHHVRFGAFFKRPDFVTAILISFFAITSVSMVTQTGKVHKTFHFFLSSVNDMSYNDPDYQAKRRRIRASAREHMKYVFNEECSSATNENADCSTERSENASVFLFCFFGSVLKAPTLIFPRTLIFSRSVAAVVTTKMQQTCKK